MGDRMLIMSDPGAAAFYEAMGAHAERTVDQIDVCWRVVQARGLPLFRWHRETCTRASGAAELVWHPQPWSVVAAAGGRLRRFRLTMPPDRSTDGRPIRGAAVRTQ